MRAARFYVEQSGGLRSMPQNRAGFRPISSGTWRRLGDYTTEDEAKAAARLARERGGLRKTRVRHRGKTVWDNTCV